MLQEMAMCGIGEGAGLPRLTGNYNIAIGYNAIVPNLAGNNQVAIGVTTSLTLGQGRMVPSPLIADGIRY
jgi:hypothetical protein